MRREAVQQMYMQLLQFTESGETDVHNFLTQPTPQGPYEPESTRGS